MSSDLRRHHQLKSDQFQSMLIGSHTHPTPASNGISSGTSTASVPEGSATMDAQALLVASVSIDGPHGRLLGTTVEGQGHADAEAGYACSGGAKGLADAAGIAIKDTVRKIGEAVSNSERVRASS